MIRASFPQVFSRHAAAAPFVALQAIQTIATVKMSGKRLLQLINDILDAAKMKQGGLVIKHQQVGRRRGGTYGVVEAIKGGCRGGL